MSPMVPADLPPGDAEAMLAAVDLARRTGARGFEFGFGRDNAPTVAAADWWALVKYQGARIITEHHASPGAACDALARRLLQGGECQNCGRRTLVAGDDDDAVAVAAARGTHGRVLPGGPLTPETACLWERDGEHWIRRCDL